MPNVPSELRVLHVQICESVQAVTAVGLVVCLRTAHCKG